MGALDFTWNAIQSDQIDDLDDKVKALEKDMETARAWIEHLAKRIEALENERKTETTGGTGS